MRFRRRGGRRRFSRRFRSRGPRRARGGRRLLRLGFRM